jgi:hypothetical protein
MEATELDRQLCDAIKRRLLVMFEYGDLIRVVEPHRVGVNSAGHPMLSGWLRAGYSRSDPAGGWRNYLLADVRSFQVLAAPFAGPRPGYALHDARMREVFCQLDASPAASATQTGGPYVVREPASGAASASSAELADRQGAPSHRVESDGEPAANHESRRG